MGRDNIAQKNKGKDYKESSGEKLYRKRWRETIQKKARRDYKRRNRKDYTRKDKDRLYRKEQRETI